MRSGGSAYPYARIVRPRRHSNTSSSRAARPMAAAIRMSRGSEITLRASAVISFGGFIETLASDPRDDVLQSVARLQVGEDERPRPAHHPCVARHHAEIGAHVRREIDLVDDQQVRSCDAGAALARDLVAT